MRLHRLSAHRDGLEYIRNSLAGRKELDENRPFKLQVYAWEASFLFLFASIVCSISGLAVLVWLGAVNGQKQMPGKEGEWDDGTKVSNMKRIVVRLVVFFFFFDRY